MSQQTLASGTVVDSVLYDHASAPLTVLVRTTPRDGQASWTAALLIEGLDPQRAVSVEEKGLGIASLDPPVVSIAERGTPKATHQELLGLAARAVQSACTSTTGTTGGPGGLAMTYYRVTRALRHALRTLGEQI